MRRCLVAAAVLVAAFPAPHADAWTKRSIRRVVAAGLFPGATAASFGAAQPLTRGDLARLVAALPAAGPVPPPTQPGAPATLRELDRAFVRALGLRDLAADVARGLRGAGFTAPAGAGAMVVARTLGLHYNHPPGSDAKERFPGQTARRGDGAYATWKVLAQQGWELGFARQHLGDLSIPPVPAGALPALARAVAEIGAPYVWGGESHAEGGFDCSGLVVNVEVDASWLGGRTTRDMARATPRPVRVGPARVSAGDVVLFGPRGRKTPNRLVDHVGLALGGGWFIHAGGQGVTLDRLDAPWWASAFVFARRPG